MGLKLKDLQAATPTQGLAHAPRLKVERNDDHSSENVADFSTTRFQWCLDQHQTRHEPMPIGKSSGRNAWLAAFAFFCNEKGVSQYELEDYALQNWIGEDFFEAEIRTTIKGIYQREAAKHGSKPYEASRPRAQASTASATGTGNSSTSAATIPAPLETPTIPEKVFAGLPHFLQQCCIPFQTDRERDVMLTGTLSVLSGCFPTLSGIYDGNTVGANMFSFTVAPAANGKGGLTWARYLAQPYHKDLVEQSKKRRAEYDQEMEQYQQEKRASAGKKGALLPSSPPVPPEEPAFRQLYVPANSSASGLIKVLADNDGHAIVCETEADTLSGALQQDWGNYSDLLRKAFHHESYTYQRKTGKEFYELDAPAISIALTGTPGQVQKLIPTAEDGLFSRFLFYAFEAPHMWRDVSPAAGRGDLKGYFTQLSISVSRMILAATIPIRVDLTSEQWQQLNEAGAQWLQEAVEDYGQESGSVVKRLGLSAFRIAMLLTLIRAFENGEQPSRLVCEQVDFEVALTLIDVYRAHALALFDRMPRPAKVTGRHGAKAAKEQKIRELYAQGLSLRDIESQTGVARSTISRWLKC